MGADRDRGRREAAPRGRVFVGSSGRWYPLSEPVLTRPTAALIGGDAAARPGMDRSTRSIDNGSWGTLLVMAAPPARERRAGPELDQGAFCAAWRKWRLIPTDLPPTIRYVRWSGVDSEGQTPRFSVNLTRPGLFEFANRRLLPMRFTPSDYRDIGGGRSVLTPFLGNARLRAVTVYGAHEMMGLGLIAARRNLRTFKVAASNSTVVP